MKSRAQPRLVADAGGMNCSCDEHRDRPPDPTMFSMSALMARQTRETIYPTCVQAKKSEVLFG